MSFRRQSRRHKGPLVEADERIWAGAMRDPSAIQELGKIAG